MPINFFIKSYRPILLIIGAGYLCVLLGLILIGMQLSQSISDFKAQTLYLYQHPYQVNAAAREARLAISGIRNELTYAIVDSDTTHPDLADNIKKHDDALDRSFQTIEDRFLGDQSKVREAQQIIGEWRRGRAELVMLLESGRHAEAKDVWMRTINPLYASLIPKIDYVVAFSSEKARYFAEQAQLQADVSRAKIRIFLVVFGLLTLFAGVTTILFVLHALRRHEAMEEQIHQLAFYDALTNLPNRRLLSDRLTLAMAAGKRSGCYGALLFLDLDNFKPLNDRYGHKVGDLLLIEVANRLRGCVREADTVARFGGDEFVVMLNELDVDKAKSTVQAEIVAEKILASLAEPYRLSIEQQDLPAQMVEYRCSASIGVTLFGDYEHGQDEIIKRADLAMYRAKEAGHNRIRFYAQETVPAMG